MNTEEKIKAKLADMGKDYDRLKPDALEHLIKIEEVISQKEDLQKQGLELLAEAEYTISDISQNTGIGRTTIYQSRDGLLKGYIQFSMESCKNPKKVIEEQRDEIAHLKSMVRKMEKRDARILLLQKELADTKREINSLQEINEKQKAQLFGK